MDVDEEGTEAAAVTVMPMVGASIAKEKRQPKIFNADHPFIFGIWVHENIGTILFLERLMIPPSSFTSIV